MFNQDNKIQVTGNQTFMGGYFESKKHFKEKITQILNEYNIIYYNNYAVGDYVVNIYIPILKIMVLFDNYNKNNQTYIKSISECELYIVTDDNSLNRVMYNIILKIIENIQIIQLANEIINAESETDKMMAMKNFHYYVVEPMKIQAELQKRIINLDSSDSKYEMKKTNDNYEKQNTKYCLLRLYNKKFKFITEKIDDFTIYNSDNVNEIKILKPSNKYMGYVYLLEWNDMIKIGYTRNPYQRYNDLKSHAENYSNAQIGKFVLFKEHTNYKQNEYKLHQYFKDYRKPDTELFAVKIEQVLSEIHNIISFLNETKKYKEKDEMIYKFDSSFLGFGKNNFNS